MGAGSGEERDLCQCRPFDPLLIAGAKDDLLDVDGRDVDLEVKHYVSVMAVREELISSKDKKSVSFQNSSCEVDAPLYITYIICVEKYYNMSKCG